MDKVVKKVFLKCDHYFIGSLREGEVREAFCPLCRRGV